MDSVHSKDAERSSTRHKTVTFSSDTKSDAPEGSRADLSSSTKPLPSTKPPPKTIPFSTVLKLASSWTCHPSTPSDEKMLPRVYGYFFLSTTIHELSIAKGLYPPYEDQWSGQTPYQRIFACMDFQDSVFLKFGFQPLFLTTQAGVGRCIVLRTNYRQLRRVNLAFKGKVEKFLAEVYGYVGVPAWHVNYDLIPGAYDW